jgi:hypothetical protein
VHYAAKAPPTLLGAGKRLQHWKSPSEIRCVCANSAAPSPVAITRAAALVALDPEFAELADQIAEDDCAVAGLVPPYLVGHASICGGETEREPY